MAQLPKPGGGQRSQQDFIIFENFEKMNTKNGRIGLKENELAWLENLQPIAPNKMLTVPAASATALVNGSETNDLIFYAAINGVDYLITFTTAGAAFAVNIGTAAVTTIAPDGTFSTAPDVTTWQASRILIYDSTAGYCTWDTTTFVVQGGVSPNLALVSGGSGYASAPTVTIGGGNGTGATASATVSNGSVVSLLLTAPGSGYLPTDILNVTFTGGGLGSGAKARCNMSGAAVTSLSFSSNASYVSGGNFALIFSGGGGSGASGTAAIGNVGGTFVITAATLTGGGSGYTSIPTISIAAEPSHSGATAIFATLGTQTVSTITVTAGGTGYTAAPAITIVGGGPGNSTPVTPATATATVSGGAVTVITVNTHGSGYITPANPAPIVVIGGTKAVAQAHVWPFLPFGTTLAVFQGRVWLGGSTTLLQWSGTGSTVTLTTATVVATGSTYTTATGVVVLKLTAGNAANFVVNELVLVTSLSASAGASSLSSLNGYFYVTAVSTANNTISYTAPSGLGTVTITGGNVAAQSIYNTVGYDDFRATAASGSLQITDADLVHKIAALRSVNNYLFIVGDQSVKQIGNISLSSNGLTTLFTILTLSSDQGTLYPKSCLSYDRIFMFVNPNGVYGVFGSTVQKISNDLDGIFSLVDFSQQPQSALLDLNAIHNAVWLLRYKDPVQGTRSIMIMFDGRRWYITSQGTNLSVIASAPMLSSDQNVIYGTLASTDITQLFASTSTTVAFTVQTSLSPHGNVLQGKKIIRAGFTADASASGVVAVELDADSKTQALSFAVSPTSVLVGGTNDTNNTPVNLTGVNIGMTLTGTLANFTLVNMALEFQEAALWKGESSPFTPTPPQTTLLLHFDGSTIVDSSGHNPTITSHGGAFLDTSQSVFGGSSLRLANTSITGPVNYVTIPANTSNFTFAGDYTIDYWIRFDTLVTDGSYSTHFASANGVSNGSVELASHPTGDIVWLPGGVANGSTDSGVVTLNTWYHIALVRTGSDTLIFLNGNLVFTKHFTSGTRNSIGMFRLGVEGANDSTFDWSLGGWLDEFRVVNGVAVWTSNFTPPTSPYSFG